MPSHIHSHAVRAHAGSLTALRTSLTHIAQAQTAIENLPAHGQTADALSLRYLALAQGYSDLQRVLSSRRFNRDLDRAATTLATQAALYAATTTTN